MRSVLAAALALGVTASGLQPALAQEPTGAAQPLDVRQAVILTTLVETTLATAALFRERAGEQPLTLSWSAMFSGHHWEMEGAGNTRDGEIVFEVQFGGLLVGENGSDWAASFSGRGVFADQPLGLQGISVWRLDPETNAYDEMEYAQLVQFGSNTGWGWLRAAEIVGGGGVGALTGLAAGPAAAIGGAALGAMAVWSFSTSEIIGEESDTPPSPPDPPERPEMPSEDKPELADNEIMVAIAPDGTLIGAGPNGARVDGSYDVAEGTAFGKVDFPE